MKVLKFGGSSVANADNFEKVISTVQRAAADGPCAVVLSAMQGTTDELIESGRLAERGDDGFSAKIGAIREKHLTAAASLISGSESHVTIADFVNATAREIESLCEGVSLVRELSPRTLDRIVGFGELLSSKMLAAALDERGVRCEWKDSRELIVTDSNFGFAAVNPDATNIKIREYFDTNSASVFVLPGFIAANESGDATTLGRGGSDYTAAIIAAAIDADVLEIWTDVSGMMTADPRFVRNVRRIPHISYREAMELSHFGAKVIYPPTVQPVMAKGIPVRIKNTFAADDVGTLIESVTGADGEIIRGISSIDKICVLSLEGSGMVGIPGFSKRLFDALSRSQINVVLITQSSSEHSICVGIEDKYSQLANHVVDREFENEIAVGKIDPLKVENGFSILALVGDNMKAHTGVSGRMFTTLGHNGINIHAIAQGSSERNISAIINSRDVRKAVNTLHEEFFSDGKKQINLYIAGVGTVGKRLLSQIKQQFGQISDDLKLNLKVVGLANSRQAMVDEEGLNIDGFTGDLEGASAGGIGKFADEIIERNLRNSIFVDVTASPDVVAVYERLLARSVSVIACNKIACSSGYESYAGLKRLAREYNASFLFETNVGAGLPVITTLNDLLHSGDRVKRIEAVLSGTLNFVFNNYDGTRAFADVVRQAQAEGYTEPDPRLDLSGTDVARKILILAREAGNRMEMGDIENISFLPESCMAGSVGDFYNELERNETHFRQLLDEAVSAGKSLKYIASFADGKASVSLQTIGKEHDFANLSGKDNAVLFYTNRYAEQPLVIKGAGAGAGVTAAGVFADIIRASRS
ncbi:MAG: bifunctional aspartate kinase/homoserine dehydrogenase I [Acidobacteriota bacterium]